MVISEHYQTYLALLRELVNRPSVFTDPEGVEETILYCKGIFEKNLPDYRIWLDGEKNLIAAPPTIDETRDVIYLSAHVDTVGASAGEWDAPFQPFAVYEDDTEMVGRGVSDCKAGVAFQLFLSHLAKEKAVVLSNVIFTVTFKEEGAGKKTSREIGKELGRKLPVSGKDTYLIVLENNVTVAPRPTLSVYTAEKGNFVIKVSGHLSRLQAVLKHLSHWNPISIAPEGEVENLFRECLEQKGGHACSVPREKNRLTEIVLNAADHDLIKAGDENNFAVIPTKIHKGRAATPVRHALVLSNRSFDTLDAVLSRLEGIDYLEMKDFSISQGLDIREKFARNKISGILKTCETPELEIRYTHNIGASDATIINNAMDQRYLENFYSLVMGPGSRSQREISPQRLTHGKNETFHKKSGEKAMVYLVKVLEKLGGLLF